MEDILASSQPKFSKILEVVKQDLNSVRTGKASPQLLENLIVEAYGTNMKLVELATITASDPTTLLISPFDIVNAPAISKAIQEANLGLTAMVEDTSVRVNVPSLSEERRQEYVKLAKTKVEGGKVMTRQIRHEAMEQVAKSGLDDDTMKLVELDIQKMVDQTVEKLDKLHSDKEKELLTV